MQISLTRACVAAGLLGLAPLSAQAQVAFPLADSGFDPANGQLMLRPDAAAIRSLASRDAATLVAVPLPTGQRRLRPIGGRNHQAATGPFRRQCNRQDPLYRVQTTAE